MLNYIQVEDKFYKVALNDKGAPFVTEISAEEAITVQFENITFLDDNPVDTSMFQEVVDSTRAKMKQQIESDLNGLILSALGFSRNDRGGFVVSGFSDKKSPIAEHIVNVLQKKFFEYDLHKELNLTPTEIGKLKTAMTIKFKQTYEEHMGRLVWQKAKELAESHVREHVQNVLGTEMKQVANTLLKEAVIKNNGSDAWRRELEAKRQAREEAKKPNDDLE